MVAWTIEGTTPKRPGSLELLTLGGAWHEELGTSMYQCETHNMVWFS